MPNWCENSIVIESDEETLKEIKEFVAGDNSEFSFFSILPHEGEWDYNWCVNNWGTKWDAGTAHRVETPGSLTYYFNTAWAPPEPVIERLSELFPKATIRHAYDEPGMDFGGYTIYAGGVEVERVEGDSRCNTYHEMASFVVVDTTTQLSV